MEELSAPRGQKAAQNQHRTMPGDMRRARPFAFCVITRNPAQTTRIQIPWMPDGILGF